MKNDKHKKSDDILTLDAAMIPDYRKKDFFLQTFDNLRPDEEFIIINTHDASPLKKLFTYERPGMFDWTYLEEGPAQWKFLIRKKSSETLTVEELININPASIYFLLEKGIDFYTNTGATIHDLFSHKRESYEEIIEQGVHYQSELFKAIRPQLWSIKFTIDFIIENHHHYLHTKLPELNKMIHQLADNFGTDFPHLITLSDTFTQFMEEILEHFRDEENEVFPAILSLASNGPIDDDKKGIIRDKLNWIIEDHYLAGDNLKSIRHICNNFRIQDRDVPGLSILHQELIALEKDFLLHILFENHFLVKAVEKDLFLQQ